MDALLADRRPEDRSRSCKQNGDDPSTLAPEVKAPGQRDDDQNQGVRE